MENQNQNLSQIEILIMKNIHPIEMNNQEQIKQNGNSYHLKKNADYKQLLWLKYTKLK